MDTAPTTSRVDLLAEAVRRLRQHLGPRLDEVYLLGKAPYDPSAHDDHLHLVAVLHSLDDSFAESEQVHDLLYDLAEAQGGHTWIDSHLVASADELALRAQVEGVRL